MSRDFGPPLSELEKWLLLRGAAERLEADAGFDVLVTAWHNGLGIAACNWPVYLERRYGEQAIWACLQELRPPPSQPSLPNLPAIRFPTFSRRIHCLTHQSGS